MKRIHLAIQGMTCQGCMNTVKRTLSAVDGVVNVDVNLVPGSATILCQDSLEESQLIEAIHQNTPYQATFQHKEDVLPKEHAS